MSQKKAIIPAGRHALYEKHGYSAAIQSKDLLFVSGQVGSLEDGSPEMGFEKQVTLAFENLRKTLAAAGCTFDDIIDITTFHTDPESQLDAMMKVKNSIFKETPYPAWTAVGVTWLAGFDFEIKAIARLPS
ncbi:RidA family protein [Psychrobacter sp. B38]|uniref:RidA family protein n=1 Tax=Psychrobacter sp. B38 TaxID=3143538 RepID=UPI00320F1C1B